MVRGFESHLSLNRLSMQEVKAGSLKTLIAIKEQSLKRNL